MTDHSKQPAIPARAPRIVMPRASRLKEADRGPAASTTIRGPASTAGSSGIPKFDVKAVQRRAYERGREVERAEGTAVVEAAAAALRESATTADAVRRADRQEIEEFAVRLACIVAEEVVGKVVAAGDHDVPAMVQRVLDQVLPDLEGTTVSLFGHPRDLARLPEHFGERNGSAPGVRPVPDGTLARGTFRVGGGDLEYFAGVSERLEAMREALLQEGVGDSRDGRGNDA